MNVVILNHTKKRIPAALVRRVIRSVKKRAAGSVEVVLVGNREMQKLNLKTRGKNKSTDVLSFPLGISSFVEPTHERILGTIVVNVDMVRDDKTLAHHLIHGTLHLLGKHHATEAHHKKIMRIEERLIKKITHHGYSHHP